MKVFSTVATLSEAHDKWLPETAFPVIGSILKHPRYKNKRCKDPFVKMFIDTVKIEESDLWCLPHPNEEAAYKSLAKYNKVEPALTDEQIDDLNLAWDWTENHFGQYMRGSRVRSIEEVIPGLDRRTSPGAPFNQVYATKAEWLEDPDLMQWLGADWERLATDPTWTCTWTNALKEEMRLKTKMLLNSLRTFLASPGDLVIHGNRLFADQNELFYKSHVQHSATVGMNPMLGFWDELIRKLDVFPNGYALDESEYDSSLRRYMLWRCALMRWRCLREEDQTQDNLARVLTVYRNIVNSVIISPEGVLVVKQSGNPSGSINTITDNTFCLYALMAYAWIRNSRVVGLEVTHESFERNTRKALCGDDNTWTVSDWAHPFYNAYTVIDVWKEVGITTTTDSMKPRRADELDYLSATTVYMNGVRVPVYNREKLLTSTLHCTKKLISPAHTLTRVAGILVTGFTDIPYRRFARALIEWLVAKYDRVCAEDPEWIIAKCSVLSDAQLAYLWTGRAILTPQSVDLDKVNEPHNAMSTAIVVRNGPTQAKRRRNRRRKQQAAKKQVVVQVQNRRRRRNKRPRKGNARKDCCFNLSKCSMLYLRALSDPFAVFEPLPCIPDRVATVSKKLRTQLRGTMYIGSASVGFLVCAARTFGNDSPNVAFSDATYAGTTLPATLAGTGVAWTNNPMPYTNGDLAASLGYRLVGCGIRLRYTGTELNRGGMIIPFFVPMGVTAAGWNASNFLSRPEVRTFPVSRGWRSIGWKPTFDSEMNYSIVNYSMAAGNAANMNFGFLVTGGAVGNSFEWEQVAYYEVINRSNALQLDGATPSHSDEDGLSAIRNAIESSGKNNIASEGQFKEYLRMVMDYVPADMSGWVSNAGAEATKQAINKFLKYPTDIS